MFDVHDAATETPIVKLVNALLSQAVTHGASDVHFEAETREMRVRIRVDGVLEEIARIPGRMVPGVVSRIKIMCELDISERRLPQDGRVGLNVDGKQIDIRVVTLPTVHGESVVMRILDRSNVLIDIPKLGLDDFSLGRLASATGHAHGSVLVTGPTGSGKSTTLYAVLNSLNTPDKNIVTIEDPVEYQLPGVTQVAVNSRSGLTFATGLRAMMRADPDIIMVGEIRDRETAQISIEAALTGHLLLSTLHTNDAPSSITRLVEMGIEPFLVASSVRCVIAQRLARVLCTGCKQPVTLEAERARAVGLPRRATTSPVTKPRAARGAAAAATRAASASTRSCPSPTRSATSPSTAPRRTGSWIRRGQRGCARCVRTPSRRSRQGVTAIDEVLRVLGA